MKFGFITTEGGAVLQRGSRRGSLWRRTGLRFGLAGRTSQYPQPLLALTINGIGWDSDSNDACVVGDRHCRFAVLSSGPSGGGCSHAGCDLGRTSDFGAAIGYRPPEFELYDVSLEDRGARYVEMLKIMRALWTQDHVDYNGRLLK